MTCFVIMPFGDSRLDPSLFRKMEDLYTDWIKPTVESIEVPGTPSQTLSCHRADKHAGPGNIIEHVIENLLTADIVVADLTGMNANVFYELGVRHATRDATILVAEGIEHIPFDLRALRTIVYEYTPSRMLAFRRELESAFRSILSNPHKVDSPVHSYLLRERILNTISTETQPRHVDNLVAEVRDLRHELQAQLSSMRAVMQVATATGTQFTQSIPDLQRFHGVWRSQRDGSMYCAKMIRNDLHVAYSFANANSLAGRLHSIVVSGGILTCRFEWFDERRTNGFVVLRLISEEEFVGGWCYAHDLPAADREALVLKQLPPDKLNEIVAQRDPKTAYPQWAIDYFDKV